MHMAVNHAGLPFVGSNPTRRTMKVILLKNIAGVGQQGVIKDVSDGYAFNYLIPQRLAEAATPEKIAQREAEQKTKEAQKQNESKALATRIESLNGARLEIQVRASEKGGLFKSLGAGDIAKTIQKERGVSVSPENIELSAPIKSTGEHTAKLHGGGANAEITLVVNPQA